ncbi:MAG TPA: antibiotic biosynthesis monooxygenase [Chloroflexia bacterium]|nr:antibiotic biosynthesis monooxygenase [Chloroflexia bacterium]
MIVVMVRIPVGSDEEGDGLVNRFKNRAGLVNKHPGFMGFELLKGEGEYVSMTRWADQQSLDAWMQSQAHEQAHARVPAAMGGSHAQEGSRPMGGGSVSSYEVVIPGRE